MKIKKLFWFILLLATSISFKGQGFKINLMHDQLNHDSLFLQSYNGMKFVTIYHYKNLPSIILKEKQKLLPGMYQIMCDTTLLVQFLISDIAKEYKMNVKIENNIVSFENSPENSAYYEYTKELAQYNSDLAQIEKDFTDAQKKNLPDYMLQNMADNLLKKAKEIEAKHRTFQEKVISENQGTLLTSIVKLDEEIPTPPPSFYKNRELLQSYYAEHSFDNYTFDDPRLVYTTNCSERIKEFAKLLYQFDIEENGIPYLTALLVKTKTNRDTYYRFFDQLEKILGNYYSPFYSETTYIVMLKDALTLPDLEEARLIRYKRELKKIDKNRRGAILPNFDIKLPNDSLTTLYDIKADYMILYFQNPDCPSCVEARERMAKMPILNQAIDNKKVIVLTIYFEENEAIWRNYLKKEANPRYLNGWNYKHNIEDDELFDLRTIPYMYLVDKDKRVIKKDLMINEVEYYVKNLNSNF